MPATKCYSFTDLTSLNSNSRPVHKTVYITNVNAYSNNDHTVVTPRSSRSSTLGQKEPHLRSKTTITIANTGRLLPYNHLNQAGKTQTLKSKSAVFEENALKKHSFRTINDLKPRTRLDTDAYKILYEKKPVPVSLPITRLDQEYTIRKETFKRIKKSINTTTTTTTTKSCSSLSPSSALSNRPRSNLSNCAPISTKSCSNLAPEEKHVHHLVKGKPECKPLRESSHKLNIRIGISAPIKQINVTCRAENMSVNKTAAKASYTDSACKKDQRVSGIFLYLAECY